MIAKCSPFDRPRKLDYLTLRPSLNLSRDIELRIYEARTLVVEDIRVVDVLSWVFAVAQLLWDNQAHMN
jgi:hypothetical protein